MKKVQKMVSRGPSIIVIAALLIGLNGNPIHAGQIETVAPPRPNLTPLLWSGMIVCGAGLFLVQHQWRKQNREQERYNNSAFTQNTIHQRQEIEKAQDLKKMGWALALMGGIGIAIAF